MSNEGFDSGGVSADSSVQTGVELALDQIYVLPEGARSGDSLQIGAQVRNDGGADSGVFTVRFWLDGNVISDVPFDSIAPGQKGWKELEHDALVAGAHNLAVMVDYANEIQESNKRDNLGTLEVQIVQMPGVIDFGKDEGTDIEVPEVKMGARATAAGEIGEIVQGFHDANVELWTRYSQGLGRFAQRMEFSSASEAQFDMDAVAKASVKSLFDSALSAVVGLAEVPGLSQAVGMVKAGVEAYFAEDARSNKAWSEHEIVEYLESVDKQIEAGRSATNDNIMKLKEPLRDEFDRVSADDPQHGEATKDGRIVGGKGGDYLLDLRRRLASFKDNTPNAADFQREIGVAFAARASRSGKVEGKLIFHIELFRIPGGWMPNATDNAWTLETAAPGDHNRLAESLTKSLNGKHAWELEFPKTVHLSLTSNQGDDPWAKAEINFTTDPAAYELAAIDTSNDAGRATTELKEAWDRPSTKQLALRWDEIKA